MAENFMIKTISQEEIAKAQIEGNLPDKPSQAPLYGGRNLTPREIKAWYDKLPKLIAEYFNALIRAIPGVENGKLLDNSLAAMIKTGISEGHSLKKLFEDIKSGAFSQYLNLAEDFSLEDLYAKVTNQTNSWGADAPSGEAELGNIYAQISDEEIKALYMFVKNEDGSRGWKKLTVTESANTNNGIAIVIGPDEPTGPCLWFNTSGHTTESGDYLELTEPTAAVNTFAEVEGVDYGVANTNIETPPTATKYSFDII